MRLGFWGGVEAFLHRCSTPGSLQAAPHSQPVWKTQWGYAKCQRHHKHLGRPVFNYIWTRLPLHPSGDLGGGPSQGPSLGGESIPFGCLPPRHNPYIPVGSLFLCNLIGSQLLLNYCMHKYGTTDGMGGIIQVLMNFLVNTDKCDKRPRPHVFSGGGVQWHRQDPQDRSGSAAHPV